MTALNGARVLVAEDDGIIGLGLQCLLDVLGCEVLGPFRGAHDAAAAARTAEVDVAVLDVILEGGDVFPAAQRLQARQIPFVFVTGTSMAIPPRFDDAPRLSKPYDERQLTSVLEQFVRSA